MESLKKYIFVPVNGINQRVYNCVCKSIHTKCKY